MIQKPFKRVPRPAFTLVELLVVMSIIAILISLLVGAAIQVLKRVDEVRNRNDITQLSQAVVNFETDFSVNGDSPPSRFVLCETLADYQAGMGDPNPTTALLYSDSFSYLNRLFPRIDFATVQAGPPSWQGIDWNGNGQPDKPVLLEGDQCLVFFLGGIATTGFSSNERNPAQPGGTRKGPFFEFKTNRLVDPGRATSPGYRVYIDAYGKSPFVYLSSYKNRNGYNKYGTSDSSLIANGAYTDGTNFYNAQSFQIISAGADKKFGPGGMWTPGAAISQVEKDDMANFYESVLGH